MKMDRAAKSGFTVVEILVVIVVIAILATVTIVSYRGVTERATDASQVVAIDGWEKALKIYYARNGKLPAVTVASEAPAFAGGTSTQRTLCLGANYPADDFFAEGQCYAFLTDKYGEVDEPFMSHIDQVANINGLNMNRIGATTTAGGISYEISTRGAVMLIDPDDSRTARIIYGMMRNSCPSGDDTSGIENDGSDPALRGYVCVRQLDL